MNIYFYLQNIFKNIYYFYLLLYFFSKNFIDFIPIQNKNNNSDKIINENNKIQTNNIKLNKNYNELEIELNKEKDKNKKLNEKIIQLEKELDNERKMVKLLQDKINNSSNITELQKLLEQKNKEIEELKLRNDPLYSIKPGEKIYAINFTSIDQKIGHYCIPCKNTDIFAKLEIKLYEDYPEYKDKETYFMNNGDRIKRFKSLDENNIKSNDVLMLYTYDL